MQVLLGIYILVLIWQWPLQLGSIQVTIVHNADIHSKFEEFPGGFDNQMVGGFGRTLHTLQATRQQANQSDTHVLYLNAGSVMTGSIWYAVHGWKIAAEFIKMLTPTVMALGIYDFDTSLTNLSRYIRKIGAPVVCSNADFSKVPDLALLIRRYHAIKIAPGIRIGIVGYLTPKVKQTAPLKRIRIISEIKALKRVCGKLKKAGINLIVALGHSGYATDVKIAEEVKDIDIIVGGMSETLLWKGNPPGPEVPTETYPKVVEREDGSRALVLCAGSDTKYLGRLTLQLSSKGVIEDYTGSSIYLDENVPQDQQALDLLDKYEAQVNSYKTKVIAKTMVLLNADCTRKECNFGNMVTDAFVDYMAGRNRQNEEYWTDCGIGIVSGRAIKSNISDGNITVGDLHAALPYNHRLVTFLTTGADLLAFLEKSIRAKFAVDAGEYVQISGLFLVMDSDTRVGERIMQSLARCADCYVPKFVGLKPSAHYKVVTTTDLLKNEGHNVLSINASQKRIFKISEYEVTSRYLAKKKVVRPEVNERYSYSHRP